MAKVNRSQARQFRHRRIRKKIHGTSDRPRLAIFRSKGHIYAQLIDDESGRTIASASTIDRVLRNDIQDKDKKEQAKAIGMAIAERAKAQGIESAVFDRGGFPYHGRVKSLAEGSREGGLKF